MNHLPLLFRRVVPAAFLAVSILTQSASAPAAPAGRDAKQPAATTFHFTVTSDLHLKTTTYGHVLDSMTAKCGGQGVFQVSVGDVCDKAGQSPQTMRNLIDARFGAAAVWYPAVGNHDATEAKTSEAMTWRRAEFATGNGARTPLKQLVARPGPAGTTETTYSWDHGNAHFVVLNQYWNGETAPGSDAAADGDIVPALRTWLEADLAANTKPFVIVFGHEPAFPQFRHLDNSLNLHPENRDAFWSLLVRHRVQAFVCGHIHYFYKELREGVWQISDGNTGNGEKPQYQSYLDVIVGPAQADIRVWQNDADGSTTWHLADTITVNAVNRSGPAKSAGVPGRL